MFLSLSVQKESKTQPYDFTVFFMTIYVPEKKESEVTQSCLTLCDPMDYSLPGSSVHGVLQVRILEGVAISFPRESSLPSDQTWVSCIQVILFFHLFIYFLNFILFLNFA